MGAGRALGALVLCTVASLVACAGDGDEPVFPSTGVGGSAGAAGSGGQTGGGGTTPSGQTGGSGGSGQGGVAGAAGAGGGLGGTSGSGGGAAGAGGQGGAAGAGGTGGAAGAGGAGGAGGSGCPTWYHDGDGDGAGDPDDSVVSCTQPPNYVDNADDCDDGDERVYPGAPELCDGKDNDCNAATGEDALVTFDGSNYGTIQAALDAAEVAGGGTVYVCAGTYQENLTVAVDVDLIGLDGAAATILEPASGMTGTRVVTVESGLAVAIEGFTMQGVSTSADGGAILASEGGSTEVTACVITGNEAARGGGIFLADGTLTVTDSTLELNDATSDGGAIYAAGGTLIVRDNVAGSVINDNQAANGGAVAVVRSGSATSCSVSIAGTTLSGNAATVRGGALYLEGTDPGMGGATLDATVARATIGGGTSAEGNLANEGGGIAAVTSAAITLDGATAISHNQVTGAGGGVLLSGPITLAGPAAPPNAPSIDHNSSGGQAGGIDIDGLSTLSNLTVASNTATGQGGGFRITLSSGTLYLTAVRIEDNQSGNESAGEGGGITFTTGTVRMQYCEVLGNRATTGGGMALQADSMVIFDDGSVLQNGWDLATDLGGGAWIKSGQGVLAVANSDWGTGGTDNLPFDVWTVAGAVHAYTAYGAGANFTCDNQGCN